MKNLEAKFVFFCIEKSKPGNPVTRSCVCGATVKFGDLLFFFGNFDAPASAGLVMNRTGHLPAFSM